MSGAKNKSPSDPLAPVLSIFRDPYAFAREWRKQGGRVVAYLCDNVPVELITAASFLPCRLGGTLHGEREAFKRLVASQYRASDFGLAVAILESLASGECEFADFLVVPHNRKSIEAVYGQLSRIRGSDPAIALPQSWLLDRSWLNGAASRDFNASRIAEFRSQLEIWRGSAITDGELSAACEAHAEGRRLLGELMALRSSAPPRLRGSDALAIIRAGQVLPAKHYNDLLRNVLAAAPHFPALSGKRVFLAGSPFDHQRLYLEVESAGGVVVGEDHCWGMRCVEQSLDDTLAPMAAIAARYHRTHGCSIACPLSQNVDACLRRARACGAEAVIFAVMRGDHTHTWTTPDELKAVREAGMAALHLGELGYVPDEQSLAAVHRFVTGLA